MGIIEVLGVLRKPMACHRYCNTGPRKGEDMMTILQSDVAIEHPPCIDECPIKTSIYICGTVAIFDSWVIETVHFVDGAIRGPMGALKAWQCSSGYRWLHCNFGQAPTCRFHAVYVEG